MKRQLDRKAALDPQALVGLVTLAAAALQLAIEAGSRGVVVHRPGDLVAGSGEDIDGGYDIFGLIHAGKGRQFFRNHQNFLPLFCTYTHIWLLAGPSGSPPGSEAGWRDYLLPGVAAKRRGVSRDAARMRRGSRARTLSYMRTHMSNTGVHVKDFILILI